MTLDEIKTTIESAVANSTVYVLDPMNDGLHLEALVISSTFEDMPLVKQHKLVMNALKTALAESVHAMGLKTFTPEKWETAKTKYNV